jgi:transposase
MSLRAIAEQLSLARKTVRQYFRQAPEPPLPTPRPLRASQLDRYEDDLLTRWSQGCHNAAQLAREIRDLGYQGGQTTVRASVAYLRTSTATGSAPRSRKQRAQAVSPRSRRWLLTRDRAHLDQEGQARLDQLLQRSPEVQALHFLAHAFLDMMRERKPVQLRAWMEQASQSGIPELKSLVAGIERDYDAVTACSPPPYSTRRALSISRENR